jgi:cell division septal protein FtsQ
MGSPSKRRGRRSRLRLPIAPFPLLLTALIGVSVAGLLTSEMTKIRVMRVSGVPDWDRERIKSLLRAYEGDRALRINPLQVERQVEWHPAVLRSEFRRNVFGRARLRVEYRQPVAWFERGESRFAVSADGTVFPLAEEPPPLSLDSKLIETGPNLSIFDSRRLGGLLDLAEKVQQKLPSLRGKLRLLASGGLALAAVDGARIEFGDRERLDDKVSALERALEQHPDLLRRAQTVNLVVPERPAVRWRY